MNNLLKQIIGFIGVSGIGWILDFTTYTILALFAFDLFWCNSLGAVAGVTFVFVSSTRFIFKNTGKVPLFVKYIIYVVYQIVLIYFISKLLVCINNMILSVEVVKSYEFFSAIASKIIVTPITMLLNFLVLKNIIEKI